MTDTIALIDRLRTLTTARIGLGITGPAQPMAAELAFRQAHAVARDAVWRPFAGEAIAASLRQHGFDTCAVSSRVTDRREYLRRPDLGRMLSDASRAQLGTAMGAADAEVVFVVGDGLAPLAAEHHAVPLVVRTVELLGVRQVTVAPVVIAGGARVALGDHIGELLRARWVIVLLGERPGLSAADSLGAYITAAPRVGCTDADRSCISNIRADGLETQTAARQIADLVAPGS